MNLPCSGITRFKLLTDSSVSTTKKKKRIEIERISLENNNKHSKIIYIKVWQQD